MRHVLIPVLSLVAGFGIPAAQAQREPGGSLPLPALTIPGGQDLSSPTWERPPRLHAPEPLELDRRRRAERQAQFYRSYPGTPVNSYAALAGTSGLAVQ